MTLDTRKSPVRAVIDTNILISAIGFGGKPRQILLLLLDKKIKVIISPILLAEFHEVIHKKFPFLEKELPIIENKFTKIMEKVHPNTTLNVVRDVDDNRVLEAAVAGKCQYIITGDKDLLDLKSYNRIIILTPTDFLKSLGTK